MIDYILFLYRPIIISLSLIVCLVNYCNKSCALLLLLFCGSRFFELVSFEVKRKQWSFYRATNRPIFLSACLSINICTTFSKKWTLPLRWEERKIIMEKKRGSSLVPPHLIIATTTNLLNSNKARISNRMAPFDRMDLTIILMSHLPLSIWAIFFFCFKLNLVFFFFFFFSVIRFFYIYIYIYILYC